MQKSNKQELAALKQTAIAWVEKTSRQPSLFPKEPASNLVPLDKCQYLGFRYGLIYESLQKLFTIFKFHLLKSPTAADRYRAIGQ